jgi:hypothetical protein
LSLNVLWTLRHLSQVKPAINEKKQKAEQSVGVKELETNIEITNTP